MLCLIYRKLLVPYAEGGLDARTRLKVERHLSGCRSCKQDLEAVQSMSSVLRGAEQPALEPAPDLWEKVSARITQDSVRPQPRSWLRVPQAVSAAAAVVLVAVVGYNAIRSDIDTPVIQSPGPKVSSPAQREPNRVTEPAPTGDRPAKSATVTHSDRALISSEAPKQHVVRQSTGRSLKSIAASSKGPAPKERHAPVPVPPAAPKPADDGTYDLYAADFVQPKDEVQFKFEPTQRAMKATAKTAPAAGVDMALGLNDGAASVEAERPGSAASFSRVGAIPESPDGKWHDTSVAASAAVPNDTIAIVESDEGRYGEYAVCAINGGGEESVVDVLNETEGVLTAALFSYP